MTTQAHEVRDEAGARALAEHLTSRSRRAPVAVVTLSVDAQAPYVDVAQLLEHVGDLVEVYVLPSGRLSYAFADHMPPGTEVWGGAARAYPVDPDWVTRPSRAPLHRAYDAAAGARVGPALATDLTSMAHAAGLVLPPSSAARPARVGSGEVKGFTASRAVVRLAGGALAMVVEERLVPGVPLERLLSPGMAVTGPVEDGRLDLRASIRPPAEALSEIEPGTLLPARVDRVTARTVSLALHPDLAVEVDQAEVTTNELDELTDLFTVGDVVTVRVVEPSPAWRLRLWDVDDDEAVTPAPALIAGGPPWLDPTPPTPASAPPLPSDDALPLPDLPDLETTLGRPLLGGPTDLPPTSPPRADPEGPSVSAALPPVPRPDPAPSPSPLSVFGRHDPPAPAPAPAPTPRRRDQPEPRVEPIEPAGPTAPTGPRFSPALLDRRRRVEAAEPTTPKPPSRAPVIASPAAAPPAAPPPVVRPPGLPRPDPGVALDDVRRLAAEQRHELVALRAERRQLAAHNRQLEDRLDALEAQLRDIRTRRRSQGKQPRRAAETPADDACFLDPEQQLRHDVLVTWARRVGPHDKARWPLRDYIVGPEFLTSLDRLEGVSRSKVLEVVVEVVTGRVRDMASSRRLHQLREGAAGSPYRRGPQGETCWRVALQVNTPSARRLHYMSDGACVTLIEVGLHDDNL